MVLLLNACDEHQLYIGLVMVFAVENVRRVSAGGSNNLQLNHHLKILFMCGAGTSVSIGYSSK